jgi:chromosome segregation ATPase
VLQRPPQVRRGLMPTIAICAFAGGRWIELDVERRRLVKERNLAGELALLATDVDSLAKDLARAKAELARERDCRHRSDSKAGELREQLGHAQRRARTAERELGRLSANITATAHANEVTQRELQARLDVALHENEQLQQDVERKERQRHALAANLREVMGNLRHAAQEARDSTEGTPADVPEEATLVPPGRGNGW